MAKVEHDDGPAGVVEAFDGIVRLMMRHLTDREGLTFTTIMLLSRLDRHGAARLSELATAEGISQPSISQLAQRLEAQGLVLRTSDPLDARASLLAISDTGRALVADRLRQRHHRLAVLLTALPPEDSTSLYSAMSEARPVIQRLTKAARTGSGQTAEL